MSESVPNTLHSIAQSQKNRDTMIQVTKKQNEYLLELATGPKTTRDLMLSQMVTMSSAARMIGYLREDGLVRSSKLRGTAGNVLEHKLIKSYKKLVKGGIEVVNRRNNTDVTCDEILYVAILRNGLLTGQELIKQHLKVFPNRKPGGVSNIIDKAKAARLCR